MNFDNRNGTLRRQRMQLPKGVRVWACALALACALGRCAALDSMRLQYTWGEFNFEYESDKQRLELEASPDFAPENTTPFDVDYDWQTKRVFLAMPAVQPGSPVALAVVADPSQRQSPKLRPYPDWSWHHGQRGCDGLTSVFRIYVDTCRRLWAIDSGAVNISGTQEQKCPPQLFVFNLKNNKLILRHKFDIPKDKQSSALLLTVVSEHTYGKCNNDAFTYVADAGSRALYVFDMSKKKSWRVESETFQPEAGAGQFFANGFQFALQDGVLGLAQDEKMLYYHSFSGFKEHAVPKSVLRKQQNFPKGGNQASDSFKTIGRRDHQSAGQARGRNKLFFGEIGTNSLYCWDKRKSYEPKNHFAVDHDDNLLKFITSVKVKAHGFAVADQEVWTIDNSGERIFSGKFRANVPYTVNIVSGPLKDLEKKC